MFMQTSTFCSPTAANAVGKHRSQTGPKYLPLTRQALPQSLPGSGLPVGLSIIRVKVFVMQWMDLMQGPAIGVTLLASWLVASSRERRRGIGFWIFLASNAMWIAWGLQAQAWALVVLQIGLAAMNIRGARRNPA
jgi:hypothetical protein